MSDVTHYPGTRHDDRTATVHTDRTRDEATFLPAILKRTSWGAVVAGTVVAIGAQMFFTLLGIAIGVTAADGGNGAAFADETPYIAALWWLITGTLSLLLAGFVVGRFAGMTRSPDVLLHGLTMWAATAILGFFIVALVGSATARTVYGTGLNAIYMGSQPASPTGGTIGANRTAIDTPPPVGTADSLTANETAEYVQTAAWWALAAFALGIGASLLGSWLSAPHRIVMHGTPTVV